MRLSSFVTESEILYKAYIRVDNDEFEEYDFFDNLKEEYVLLI